MAAIAAGPIRSDDEAQQGAERSFFRAALIGTAAGLVLGPLVWAGIIAAVMMATDRPVVPSVWIGAAVGAFFGVFFGGWAGVVVGAGGLEHHEHETLPHL